MVGASVVVAAVVGGSVVGASDVWVARVEVRASVVGGASVVSSAWSSGLKASCAAG